MPFYMYTSSSSSSSTISASNWNPSVSLTLNHPTLHLLEKSCRSHHHFKQILAQMMRLHLTAQTFPMSRLLCFAAVSGHEHLLHYAILLFHHFTPNPNLFIFNTMISALSFSLIRSVALYKSMLSFRISPNEQSLLSLLKFCDFPTVARQIHAHAVVHGFNRHVYLQNSLINVYMVCDEQDSARQVFVLMPLKDAVSFNTMISRYAEKGFSLEAFEVFRDMIRSGTRFDEYTAVGLLQACGRLKSATLGKSVHAVVMRRMPLLKSFLILSNAIMDMYSKCEEMRIASKVFDGLEKRDEISWNIIISGFAGAGQLDIACEYFTRSPVRDLISWNSLLAGYAREGEWREALIVFEKMLARGVKPDKITSAALVSAASEMGVLDRGRCVHGWAVKVHGYSDAFLGSALIDMYSKCGSCEGSLRVFNLIEGKDVAAWTAMIAALGFHGRGIEALELFGRLRGRRLVPNSVTFIAVLAACSHTGLVDQGLRIFSDMKEEYGVEPGVEHYGCLVDLLARSGKIDEARDLMRRMEMEPSESMWGAILSASTVRSDVKLAMEALEKLDEMGVGDDGGYVMMSNAYASCGRWSNSDTVRGIMGGRGMKKTAGWSGVVIDGILHDFVASDKRRRDWEEIHSVVFRLHKDMASVVETLLKFS
ncbi:Pentatricopeptide repeat-containing protein [Platanthera zijinensis]|uniref:Pentatricopeptide repeat-containing protein n=1 Tax=Platanthera zijinensis TaxID=2320716 RepID=A0AAP0FYA9_9ASPA